MGRWPVERLIFIKVTWTSMLLPSVGLASLIITSRFWKVSLRARHANGKDG